MQKLELFDETFDPFRTETYELSIQASLDGFSFCVKDNTRSCFIALGFTPHPNITSTEDWARRVEHFIASYEWLKKTFAKVIFSFNSSVSALIPKALFEKERIRDILVLSHTLGELDEVGFRFVDDEICSLFSMPSTLTSAWLKQQENTLIIGPSDAAIVATKLKSLTHKEALISITFFQDFATVVLALDGKLSHMSNIEIGCTDNIAYTLLNICKHTATEPTNVTIQLTGNYPKIDSLQETIARYFKKVNRGSSTDQFHYSYQLSNLRMEHANLFNQSLCAL